MKNVIGFCFKKFVFKTWFTEKKLILLIPWGEFTTGNMEKILILVLVAGIGLARAWVSKSNWNESYVKIATCKKCKNYEGKYGKDFYILYFMNWTALQTFLLNFSDVSDVSFRLYNTKFYQPKKDIWEEIEYNERHDKVSLAEGTMFDQSSRTLVVAHGNSDSPAGESGGHFGKNFCIHYAQVNWTKNKAQIFFTSCKAG